MTLTLQVIRDHRPCQGGWKALTKSIGSDLTTELSIGDVVISNGINDALWCLQCLEPRVRVAAIMPTVKRASVHTDDKRVHDCIADIDKWLAGDDTVDLKAVARAAAWAAAEAAEEASWSVAEAAQAAAQAAALRAEQAAQAAAQASSWEAERKLQEADLLVMFPPIILKGEQP